MFQNSFFSPVLLLFSYQTPHCIKTICPHRALQCQALLAKNYNLRSSLFRISWTRTFCWPLLNQMKTVFQSNKIFPPWENFEEQNCDVFFILLARIGTFRNQMLKRRCFCQKIFLGRLASSDGCRIGMLELFWSCNKEFLEAQPP